MEIASLLGVLVVSAVTLSTPAKAQWLDLQTPGIPRTAEGAPDMTAPVPRTADGLPDLSGPWVPVAADGSMLDAGNAQTWAQEAMYEREREFFEGSPRFECLPSGPAYLTALGISGGPRRIVQSPSMIAFLYDDLAYRQVHMDGRQLEANPFPTWMGYHVGHWDGDTLVVESNGYNDQTWLHRRGQPHTEALRITERYTRTNFGHMRVDITYDDPGTFDEPVHAAVDMEFMADEEVLESVCAEATESFSHRGTDIEDVEATLVEVSADTLNDYVGTYEGVWLGSPTTLEFTLQNNQLMLLRTPPYAATGQQEAETSGLIARTENRFECTCGIGFIFVIEDGAVTRVDEVHVSGAWPFARVR